MNTTTKTTNTTTTNASAVEAFELAATSTKTKPRKRVTNSAQTAPTADELKAILTTLQGSLQNAFKACGALAKACLNAPANVPLGWLTDEVIQKLRATGFKVIRDKKSQTAVILVALNPDKTPQWQEVEGVMTRTTYTKPVESKGYTGVTKGDINARITAKLSLTREQLEYIQKHINKLF